MKKIQLILFAWLLGAPLFAQSSSAQNFDMARSIDIFTSACKEIDMLYVDTINAKKVVRAGVDAMLRQLDPYTVYYSEEDMGDLKLMTTGKYAGIGSLIRLYHNDQVIVAEPYANTPAAKAGLKAGDVMLKIDDIDLKGKSTSEVSELLRGEPNTSFLLTIQRRGEKNPRTVKLTRETITNPAIPYYGMVSPTVGYINLNQFTDNCAKEVRAAVIELRKQGATGLVLDLRDNGGGSVGEAVDIVNLFVPKNKVVVSLRGKAKAVSREYKTPREPLDVDIPLVVMVNGNTASSSEILAGTLQDYDRAIILGSRTFGKGLVQNVRDMPYNGSIKVTTAKYYIPSGRCIQAIDYKNRDQYGRAERIADSLTHAFKTEMGRVVRDGGGIRPDVEVKLDTLANIVGYLSVDDVLMDYATDYCAAHPTIPPVADFVITDADFDAFCKMVKNAEFKYDKQTESALKQLKEIARFEKYLTDATAEFDALEKKLNHNIDFDLQANKEDIKELLADEIVKRYYYQSGSVQLGLKKDIQLNKAKELLGSSEAYKDVLSIKQADSEDKNRK